MLAATTAADPSVQAQVLSWILKPTCEQWASPAFLFHLEAPSRFVIEFVKVEQTHNGPTINGREQRWMLFHNVHLLQRVYATGTSVSGELLTPYLDLLKVIGQILSCIYGLWEPTIRASLGAAGAILDLGCDEQRAYLRQANSQKIDTQREDSLGIAGKKAAILCPY